MKSRNGQQVESLGRVLDVLGLFTADRTEVTLTTAAQELGWPLATAHRVVKTLVERRFLTREADTKLLRLGPSVMRLAAPVMASFAPEVATPHLQALAKSLGETVNYAILDGADVLYLASGAGSFLLRAEVTPGMRAPAHCTALGKCMLAQMDAEVARQSLGEEPYAALTENSARSWDDLAPQLGRIRDEGYSLSVGEFEDGLNSCAVPLPTLSGVPAAINVAAASHRVDLDVLLGSFVPQLRDTAAAIARAQGLQPLSLDSETGPD